MASALRVRFIDVVMTVGIAARDSHKHPAGLNILSPVMNGSNLRIRPAGRWVGLHRILDLDRFDGLC
jgi:hypothetical protein